LGAAGKASADLPRGLAEKGYFSLTTRAVP
jgi:hypothetical protein